MQRLARLTLVGLLCAAAGPPPLTVIGGHSYVFPPDAFEDGVVETGRVGSILLELARPEMRPLTPGEAGAWPMRDTVRILAISGAAVNGEGASDNALSLDLAQRLGVAEGLALWRLSGHIPTPTPDPEAIPSGNPTPGGDMARVKTVHTYQIGIWDVFAQRPISSPRSFVSCPRADQFIVNPICKQVFATAGMILQVSYRRALVPQWPSIEANTTAFLHMHEVHP